MTPIRRLISEIVADLLALRVIRAHVAAPDPTALPGDRPGDIHSRKVVELSPEDRAFRQAHRFLTLGLHGAAAVALLCSAGIKGAHHEVDA